MYRPVRELETIVRERKQVRCALDACLIPPVDAIEEAIRKRFDGHYREFLLKEVHP